MSAVSSGKISLALGSVKKPPKAAAKNGVKRSHAALHDHDEEENENGKAQAVSRFDHSAGGAIDDSEPQKDDRPLVIAPQANRDWREASQRNKRQRSAKLFTPDGRPQNGDGGDLDKHEESKPTYGLNVFRRAEDSEDVVTNSNDALAQAEAEQQTAPEPNGEVSVQQKTDDELAIEALLGKGEKTDLVLPAMTEEEAFDRDFKTAPDMSTLEDYERVPVEQFGAALLRGMGWKEGEGIGSQRGKKVEKTKLPERRPALLGIGAKEEAAVAQELGTWGKAAKDRKGPVQVYNPVLLRDKKTGEMFTEEELEKKKQRDEREKYEMEFDREERRKDSDRRRKGRDDSRDRDSDRRDKGSRRERSKDRDRRRYDSDEEYYRRKEKEKRRRQRELEGSDYDRERSRRHESDRERQKDRHHDRDRRR